jgi:malate permease and related proteins
MFETFLTVLGIVAPVFLIIAIGFGYAKIKKPDMGPINTLAFDVIVPTLIFSGLASKSFSVVDSANLIFSGIAVIVGSGVIAFAAARFYKVDARTLIPTMMFNNAAFMGLPLVVIALGPERLGAGVALYVVMTIIQMTWGMRYITGSAAWLPLMKNPMLGASIVGLFINIAQIPLPQFVMHGIDMMGKAAVPIMLLSLGARITKIDPKAWKIGFLGAWLAPISGILVALPLMHFIPLSDVEKSQLLLFAALPPAVANFIIAEKTGHAPGEVASMVLFGNLAALFFVPLTLFVALGKFY